MTENQAFYKELGSHIKKARNKALLTQESLADKVSLTRTTVTNIEKGRQQLLVHTLVDIAKVLNVSIESLFPKQISTSIDDVINKKADSPQTQELIRKIHDMADWD
jgi:DNA-binding XRE family transcriptional regulator